MEVSRDDDVSAPDLHIIQWNLFVMDTLGPAISGLFLLLYRGFPLSEVKMY